MEGFREFLRRPRLFLCITVLAFGLNACPDFVEPPPDPNLVCETNVSISFRARGCAKVEPLCLGVVNWRAGDTLAITGSALDPTDSLSFNSLQLYANSIETDGTMMRRVCQSPHFTASHPTGRAKYQYTLENGIGEGLYNPVNISDHSALTVELTGNGQFSPLVYDRPSDGIAQFFAVAGGGTPPYSYEWFANGVVMPGKSDDLMFDFPFRNTEYMVRVLDTSANQVSASTVTFRVNGDGDPTASFTVTPGTVSVGQGATLDPSASTGPIIRWEWDFDWQGDINEAFDSTINGPVGTTVSSWSQPGRKYIRLRVTTASGNFDETFRRVTVIPAPGKRSS